MNNSGIQLSNAFPFMLIFHIHSWRSHWLKDLQSENQRIPCRFDSNDRSVSASVIFRSTAIRLWWAHQKATHVFRTRAPQFKCMYGYVLMQNVEYAVLSMHTICIFSPTTMCSVTRALLISSSSCNFIDTEKMFTRRCFFSLALKQDFSFFRLA